jgi:hypothetical protein
MSGCASSPGSGPRIRFHDLRHAHGTHLLSSGVHPKVASEWLGHSKVGISLDLCSHVLPGTRAGAVSRVDEARRTALEKRAARRAERRNRGLRRHCREANEAEELEGWPSG